MQSRWVLIKKTLLQKTIIVSFLAFLSSILGFARDVLTALLFGASPGMDAFLVAFRLSDMLRDLSTDGSFAQAFLPLLARQRRDQGPNVFRDFLSYLLPRLILGLTGMVLVVDFSAPLIILLLAPGFSHDAVRMSFAVHMLWLTSPYLFFITLVALGSALLNQKRVTMITAVSPALLNICLLVMAGVFSYYFVVPEMSLAVGVSLGGLIQLIALLPSLRRSGLLVPLRWGRGNSTLNRIWWHLPSALLGASVVQLGFLITLLLASFLQTGGISWLYYGQRLAFFPLALIGGAITSVILPPLSQAYLSNRQEHYAATLDWALRILLIVALPAAIGMILLAGPMTLTFFKHGAFTITDVVMTQRCVVAFALGLPALVAIKIMASAFYAQQRGHIPLRVTMFSLAINLVLAAILLKPFAVLGLALAMSMGVLLNAVLLLIMLIRCQLFSHQSGWRLFALQLLVANIAIGLLLVMTIPPFATWLGWSQAQRVTHLGEYIILTMLLYFLILRVSGLRIMARGVTV